MKTESGIAVRFDQLSKDNIHLLPALFEKAFKERTTLHFFTSKYDFSVVNKPLMGMVALTDNKAIGFIGVCYQHVKYGEESEWMADYTDSMVDPEFQKKGLYVQLLAKLETLCSSANLTISYGFVNKNSFYPIVHKRKWNLGKQMIGYSIPVNTFPWQKIFAKLRMNGAYIRSVTRRLKKFTVPFDTDLFQTPSDYPDIIRDERYFNWKSSPDKFLLYHNETYIWVKTGNQLAVGYISTSDPDQLLSALAFLKKIARLTHIRTIMFQFPEGSEQDQILRKHLRHFESWKIAYCNHHSQIPFDKIQMQFCDTDSF